MLNIIIISILSLFIGFAIGRFGDKYFGYLENIGIIPVPHHWVWFFPLIVISFFLFKNNLNLSLFCFFFGLGSFISDLNDFLHFRILGEEPPHKWRFWSIE